LAERIVSSREKQARVNHSCRPVVTRLAAFVVVVIAGCGGTSSAAHPSAATTIQMAEYSYAPADLTVPLNTKLTVINRGTLIHTYILRGIGRGTAEVQPGRQVTLDLAGVAPGTYPVFCDQVGHTEKGQSGLITITP